MRYLVLLLLIIGLTVQSFGQPYFQRVDSVVSYGGVVKVLSNGLLTVSSYNFGFNVRKTDAVGNTVFHKHINDIDSDFHIATDVEEVTDGYIVAAYLDNLSSYGEALLFKLDTSGNLLWSNAFTSFGNSTASSNANLNRLLVSTSGSLYGVGQVSYDNGSNACIIKFNANGDTIWTRDFSISFSESARSIVECNNGELLVGGTRVSLGGDANPFLARLDTNGNLLWSKIYYGEFADAGVRDIALLTDGGFVATGNAADLELEPDGFFLMRCDSTGNVMWLRRVESGFGVRVFANIDSTFTVAGSYNNEMVLVTYDSDGVLLWTKAFGGADGEGCSDAAKLSSGGFIVSGTTSSFDNDYHAFIVAVDETGEGACGLPFSIEADDSLWFAIDDGFAIESHQSHFPKSLVVTDVNAGVNNQCLCTIPYASFQMTYADSAFHFDNNSFAGQTFQWDFGDGTIDTSTNPLPHVFPDSTFNVCLIATNDCGSDTFCQTICVPPMAAFSYALQPNGVAFTNESNSSNEWLWRFGDGTTDSTFAPLHVFGFIDTFSVCLTASSACGYDSVCQDIFWCVPPTAGITSELFNEQLALDVLSNSAWPQTWFWDFGDGTYDGVMNPAMHYYALVDTYNLCLTVTNACGADTTCTDVEFCSLPTADFGITEGIDEAVVYVSDSSLLAESWLWDFGDGAQSTDQNPSEHHYSTSGLYTICLTVTNTCGTDSSCQEIEVVTGMSSLTNAYFNVYPNPASEYITIALAHQGVAKVELLNALGVVMMNIETEGSKSLDVNSLPDGVYAVRVTNSAGAISTSRVAIH